MCYREAVSELPAPHDEQTLYILDVSGYVFRAYHALPDLANSRGEPTHATFGTLNMLRKLLEEQKPAYMAVAMDSKLPSFRHQIFEKYKANRPPPPEDLSQQIERVRQIIEAYRIACIQRDGVEADDLIASLVKEARRRNFKVVIVSADKDLLQLVDGNVVMYDTMRGRIFGSAQVRAKLGVDPAQVGDYLALTGDSSDNIPGVPSVGPKTAAALLEQWGSLDAIYAHVDDIPRAGLKTKLKAHKDDAYLSRRLVALDDELPLGVDWDALKYNGPDDDALDTLFAELEFARPSKGPASKRESATFETVTTENELRAYAMQLSSVKELMLTTIARTDPPAVLFGIGLARFDGQAMTSPAFIATHPLLGGSIQAQDIVASLGPMLSDASIAKLSGDVKRDTLAFAAIGLKVRGWAFDAMLASYVLEPERRGHELPALAQRHLGRDLPDEAKVIPQLYQSAQASLSSESATTQPQIARAVIERLSALSELQERFMPRLDQDQLRGLLLELEIPLAEVLADMESVGIGLDCDYLATLSKDVKGQLGVLEQRCYELAGKPFNVNAPRQLEMILFDHLQLPAIKRTKTARSTDHEVLEQLALQHPLPEAILQHRTLAKLQSTYLEALPRQLNTSTRRVHTRFNQAVAATGRLSSSDPNLQNIPIRNELGRRIREAFVAKDGWWLLSADYSQIELRILAHLSKDPELLDAFKNEQDVHIRTAQALFNVEANDVTRQMRAQAKTVNFAVIYGQTDFALSRNLKITRAEAKSYIEAFFKKYAGVRQFMDQMVEQTRSQGYVRTLLGRRRHIADISSTNRNLRLQAERVAANTPIQGSAADVMKLAMLRIHRALHQQKLQSRMLLTVHDELVLEVPEAEKTTVGVLVAESMQHAVELSVPLVVDVGYGRNWGEAH